MEAKWEYQWARNVRKMADTTIHAVTGAFGYSGKYIAQRLLDQGQTVITLTNSLSRSNPFGNRIEAFPFRFDQPDLLADQLTGVSVFYNTYWVPDETAQLERPPLPPVSPAQEHLHL